MTQRIFVSDKHSWAILSPDTVAGRPTFTASHAMLGVRSAFHVYTRAAGASAWIKSQPEQHDRLKLLHLSRQIDAFIALVEKILSEHPHPG